jgi:hypothetical protein
VVVEGAYHCLQAAVGVTDRQAQAAQAEQLE